MISLHGLTKVYGRVRAVDDLTFEVGAAIVLASSLLGVALVTVASVMVWSFLPRFGLPAADGAAVLGALAFVFAWGSLMAVGSGLLVRSTAGGLVVVIALVMALPLLLAQLGYDWATAVAAHLPGSGALFLIFGEGPSDDMTTASARATLVAWALAAATAGGWRLLGTDANR